MNITLIGAGNLATQLGIAAREAGHAIIQVYSHTLCNATALAEQCGAQAIDSLSKLSDTADIYVVAVKDAVLADVVSEACRGREEKVFAHTAGSMPIDIFNGQARHYGVLYPMQTFSKQRKVDFSLIPVFTEYNDAKANSLITALANSLSDKVTALSSADRRHLHLAAVFACNFANHCFSLAADVMERHGMTFDMLLPLIDETVEKVHEMHPLRAQTGPAIRYDENVLSSQRSLLDGDDLAQTIYDTMSKSIHEKSKKI